MRIKKKTFSYANFPLTLHLSEKIKNNIWSWQTQYQEENSRQKQVTQFDFLIKFDLPLEAVLKYFHMFHFSNLLIIPITLIIIYGKNSNPTPYPLAPKWTRKSLLLFLFNSRGYFYNCNFSNVLYSNIHVFLYPKFL